MVYLIAQHFGRKLLDISQGRTLIPIWPTFGIRFQPSKTQLTQFVLLRKVKFLSFLLPQLKEKRNLDLNSLSSFCTEMVS